MNFKFSKKYFGLQLRGHTDSVYTLDTSHNGKFIISGGWDNMIRMSHINNSKQIRTFIGGVCWILSLAMAKSGKYILTSEQRETCKLWNVHTG